MNNSQVLSIDSQPELDNELEQRLRAEEGRILRIVEAIQAIEQTREWSSLKIEVFDNLVNVLEKDLRTEARKEEPDPLKLNRLSGELKWAERFSDLEKFGNTYRLQLQNVRKQLHGTRSD